MHSNWQGYRGFLIVLNNWAIPFNQIHFFIGYSGSVSHHRTCYDLSYVHNNATLINPLKMIKFCDKTYFPLTAAREFSGPIFNGLKDNILIDDIN